jgi:hypothetical protein
MTIEKWGLTHVEELAGKFKRGNAAQGDNHERQPKAKGDNHVKNCQCVWVFFLFYAFTQSPKFGFEFRNSGIHHHSTSGHRTF